jgi:PAS domain S-box-containing protein
VPPQAAAVVSGAPPEAAGDLDRQAGVVTAASAVVSEHAADAGAQAHLPGVLADVPVAVLVIDQKAGTVVYANRAAVELAGNVQLPIDVDTWGASAGLTDLAGEPLARTSGPLSLVAQGSPVTGEAVRLRPGTSSQSERAEDSGLSDEMLWVTGFPMSQVESEQRLALVVFLQLDGVPDTGNPDTYLQALRERAVLATDIAFTITDPRQRDNPLVWVNPSFSRVTGYEYDDAVGRNCRFLQGPATDPAAVQTIRDALAEQRSIVTTLLNYRKDGTAFWNQLAISPVFDGQGELVSFVGVQADVTERVRAEGERAEAFASEQAARQEAEEARAVAEQARADAERAQTRLARMSEATTALLSTLDTQTLLARLADVCVPVLADWVVLTLVDAYGEIAQAVGRHRDGFEEELEAFAAAHVLRMPETSPSRRSLATSQPVVTELTPELRDQIFVSRTARELVDRLGATSVLSVPMVARRRTLGVMTLVMCSAERSFGPEDVEHVHDLARRGALAMDNVRLYEQEHTVADTLQRSLLPVLPEIPGIRAAAHYVSASTAADVGGDFYDLLQLPDGSIGMVIGDVVGHDVAAAAAMGHLRGLIRACVWDAEDPDPARVLGRVDRLVQGLHVAPMATMVYARAVPPVSDGAPWQVHLANAGHPPLMLRHPDGSVELLDGVTGLLVGIDATIPRTTVDLELPPGSTLVAYTDGLVERPGEDIDSAIEEVRARLAEAPADADPRTLCDAAVSGRLDRRDDIALIAVRLD